MLQLRKFRCSDKHTTKITNNQFQIIIIHKRKINVMNTQNTSTEQTLNIILG